MPRWLIPLLLLCVHAFGQAQLPFENDFPPVVTFTESYLDDVRSDGVGGFELANPTTSIVLNATVSMKDIDITAIDQNTNVIIEIGALVVNLFLGEDTTYLNAETDRAVIIPIYDSENPDPVGTLELSWGPQRAQFELTINNAAAADPYRAMVDGYVGQSEPDVVDETQTVSITFADRMLEPRLLYVSGFARLFSKTVGTPAQTFDNLAEVSLNGEIDSTAPTVAITSHEHRETVHTTPITLAGTFFEDHTIHRIEASLNGLPFQPATIDGPGHWTLGVTLQPLKDDKGKPAPNLIEVRAIDLDGNVGSIPQKPFHIFYTSLSNVRVDAAGTGAGKVTSTLFTQNGQTPIVYTGPPTPARTIQNVEEGTLLTFTATAGAGSLFDGWTAVNATLTPAQQHAEKLDIRMTPELRLTANFSPNQIGPAVGKYNGLVQSADVNDRGFFTGSIAPSGAFTGKIKVGTLTLPLKGKFTASGHFGAVVKKGTVSYLVELHVDPAAGVRRLTGTVKGGTIDATIGGELSVYKSKTNEPAEKGTYTALAAPVAGNVDQGFPIGLGAGVFTVKPNGSAKFTGKLGDGTPCTAGAFISADGAFPFFAALYGKRGSISGQVQFTLTNPLLDFAGVLDWFRPAATKPGGLHGIGFNGQSQFAGTRFVKPPKGTVAILGPSGAGRLLLDGLPSFSGVATTPFLDTTDNVALPATHKIDLPTGGTPTRSVKLALNPINGLLTGTLSVQLSNGKTLKSAMSGAMLSPKGTFPGSAGGCFPYGESTGRVELLAP